MKKAFLHGSLEERIYMKQLEGFIETGLEKKVYLLKISLWFEAVTLLVVHKV